MIFTMINSYIVNLVIIISTIFVLYFSSLKYSLEHDDAENEILTSTGQFNLSFTLQIFLGIFIGLMSFVISMNRIPIDNMRPVDVRYLPVYFSVYYGSPVIGIVTTITLILTKCLEYFITGASITEYINNFLITGIILFISLVIVKKKLPPIKAAMTCLSLTLISRAILAIFFFFNQMENELLFHFLLHFLVFSSLFFITAWLLNAAISISESIHNYRDYAIFDNLTKLYNKESFFFFLDLARQKTTTEKVSFSLAIIDFDNFKEINDTYGHLIGDRVLKEAAELFLDITKSDENIRVCRIGGDEFAVIFKKEENSSFDLLEFLTKKLNQLAITETFDKNMITLSIGLIHILPSDKEENKKSSQDIFNLADKALYIAKNNGKNQIFERNDYLYAKKS
ncbi:GGDEF domain-containing protein [Vagococcus sp.]|uniref:GGDEF domain-containing protein n=1 Tax=Vagococcus sp. TaxID=1933889 RepID=UPI002FC74417